jgi:hypothetical protein
MKVTLLTRETPNAKILTNVGISTASGVVPRCLADNQVLKKHQSGSGAQVGTSIGNDLGGVCGKAVEARYLEEDRAPLRGRPLFEATKSTRS